MQLKKIVDLTQNNILIYGEGGIGKTTALVNLYRYYINNIDKEKIIPIYIPMRELKDSRNFIKNYIITNYVTKMPREESDNAQIYKRLQSTLEYSNTYSFLIMCDGINEITAVNGREVFTEIIELSKCRNVHFIVASRYNPKDVLKPFSRYELKHIAVEYAKNSIPEYSSLSEVLRKLLLIPFFYTVYNSINNKKKQKVSNAGKLITMHYIDMLDRSYSLEHKNFARLILLDYLPLLCFNMSLTGSLSITNSRCDEIFDEWIDGLTRRDRLRIINENGMDRFDYIDVICSYSIATFENSNMIFHEIIRDFFAAVYEEKYNNIKLIDGEPWIEAANKNIWKFVCELSGIEVRQVEIPKGATIIEKHAFSWSNLVDVHIPNTVEYIEEFAFAWCFMLTRIILPNSLKTIEFDAFHMCSQITELDIPEGVTFIGHHAFSACFSLKSVNIPKTVVCIDDSPFDGCCNLLSINVADDNLDYLSIDGVLFYKGRKSIIDYPGGIKGRYDIPKDVYRIGRAFHGTSISEISLPEELDFIDDFAFGGCKNLVTVKLSCNVTYIGNFAFEYCQSLESINLPEGLHSIGAYAFRECVSLKSLTIPKSVDYIAKNAFLKCEDLRIRCHLNSCAYEYAIENGISYELI